MPNIDRTAFNALVESNGTPGHGSPWDKAAIQAVILDPADAAYASGGVPVVFPATQVPSADANTLDDYEEGNFTLTDGSGAGLTITASAQATYVKNGQIVLVEFYITYPSQADGSVAILTGLPFAHHGSGFGALAVALNNRGAATSVNIDNGAVTLRFHDAATGAALTNANMSTFAIRAGGCYRAGA